MKCLTETRLDAKFISSLPILRPACQAEKDQSLTLRTALHQTVQGLSSLGEVAQEAEFPFPEMADLTWQEDVFQQQMIEWDRSGRVKRQTTTELHTRTIQVDRLLLAMMSAVKSGNIQIALMIFAGMEAKQVSEMSKMIVGKMRDLQENRRKLSSEIAALSGDKDSSKKLPEIQQKMNELDGDIAIYQQILKDILQQKQEAIELANSVSQAEHQTAMSIARR